MDAKAFYRGIFLVRHAAQCIGMNSLYDPGRAFFCVYTRVGIVLFFLVGMPALLYIGIIQAKQC